MKVHELMKRQRQKAVKVADKKLTRLVPPKEAEALKGMVAGESPSQAVILAGYDTRNPQHAAAVGKAIWNKHSDENGALVVALENVGVTFEEIAQKIKDGLGAVRTRNKNEDGKWVEVEEADHGTRHKFLETAIRVRNADPPKKLEVTHQTFESVLFDIINSQSNIEDAEVVSVPADQ